MSWAFAEVVVKCGIGGRVTGYLPYHGLKNKKAQSDGWAGAWEYLVGRERLGHSTYGL